MTSSDPENLPRHKEFFFSRNRLNVAISRAQCVAIISKTDYPDFEIRAEEASGGGDHRFKIIFEDNYTFEGSGEEWIEEVSDHLKSIGVIK